MHILVLGAAGEGHPTLLNNYSGLITKTLLGRIGSQVVTSCLARGHRVTAFVRSPTKLAEETRNHERVKVFQGDARDETVVSVAIKGMPLAIS